MSNTAGQSSGRRMAFPLLLLQQLVLFLMLQPHAAAAAKTTFDPMTHNISPVTQQNWHGKVTASRTGQVFCILFYKDNCPACQKLIDNELNTVAKNLTGMVSVLGVNCDDSPKLCKDEKVTDYPSVVVYPLMPQPPVPYKGKMSVPALTSFVGRFIPSNLIIPKDMKDFRAAMGAVLQIPKVLVFSDKPEPSTIFKALSTAFKENLQLLYLDTEKFAELVQKYKADKLPHVVVTRKDAKDQVYAGELRFQPLFDWLNIFSETFARGGGFSDTQSTTEPSADTHPWRFQSVPELTKLSSADLCFKKTLKALCVIYLKEGKELSAAETEMLESLKYEYDSSSSKGGADFRWMWMDLATEKGFKELFKKDQLPSLVVFNPHLKTRFTSLEAEEVTKDSIKGLLEKISQGKKSSLASHTNRRLVHYKRSCTFDEYHLYDSNARFKVVPSGKMPAWADRKEETKTAAQKKEKDEL